MKQQDTLVHKGLRNKLVAELQQKGISDTRVLDAIRLVPRHFFCSDSALERFAYIDKAFPIESGQTISQPYTVALQSQLLDVKPKDKILEIGTGSGYQAAILSTLGAKVYSIERQMQLYIRTKELLQNLHYPITTFLGDGFKGLPNYAPFDKIIVTAAAPYIPRSLLDQLKPQGIIVVPVVHNEKQVLVKVKKINDSNFEQTIHGECAFVPMLEGINHDNTI